METMTSTMVSFSSRLRATLPGLKLQLVSLVDGYNLPMKIDNNVGCPVADCPVDLGPNCLSIYHFRRMRSYLLTFMTGPAPLKGPFDSTGFPVGCKSACNANLDGNPGL